MTLKRVCQPKVHLTSMNNCSKVEKLIQNLIEASHFDQMAGVVRVGSLELHSLRRFMIDERNVRLRR